MAAKSRRFRGARRSRPTPAIATPCPLAPTSASALACPLAPTSASALAYALAIVLALTTPAAAAIPSPETVTNSVVTEPGGSVVGQLTFGATFTDGGAMAVAAPSPLKLAIGSTYRIRTCVWSKVPASAPASVCEELETRPNAFTLVGGVTAPTARMSVDRPAAGQPAATVAGTLLVDVHRSDDTDPFASSWPAEGLPAAGVAVPAVDQVGAPVLAPQGLALPGIRGGGINSGTQDSICREDQVALTTSPGGTTDALGSLPFAYEVGQPAAGQPVRGVMLVLHGSAWFSVGQAKLAVTRGDAERWQARGWRTVNATYRPCAASVDDVLTLYDRVRAKYGAGLPICAFGRSAGGQLALLLAARRPRLACVVAEAGIADLPALARETTAAGSFGPSQVTNWATAAFGADRLADVSAAGSPVRARVLYAISAGDTLVPWDQATAFATAQRRLDPNAYVDTLRVAAGGEPFEHALVSAAGLQEFHAREQALVAPLEIGDVVAPTRAHLRIVRPDGLRARFSCASRCTVTGRLELTRAAARRLGLTRVIGRGSAKRSARGRGVLTVRLSAAARRRVGSVTARLISDVTAGGARRRQAATVALRRP